MNIAQSSSVKSGGKRLKFCGIESSKGESMCGICG